MKELRLRVASEMCVLMKDQGVDEAEGCEVSVVTGVRASTRDRRAGFIIKRLTCRDMINFAIDKGLGLRKSSIGDAERRKIVKKANTEGRRALTRT